jgi:hypothetical protein
MGKGKGVHLRTDNFFNRQHKSIGAKPEQEVKLLSKCVNPECFATFRYLHEGKLFQLESNDPRLKTLGIKPASSEYFWLCSACVDHMTVVFHNGQVIVRPLAKKITLKPFDAQIPQQTPYIRAVAGS